MYTELGSYIQFIDSFYIDDNGNGVILVSSGAFNDKISIIKVKNFSIDFQSAIVHSHSNLFNIGEVFSYISMINDKGYIFWNDTVPYYSTISIVESKNN